MVRPVCQATDEHDKVMRSLRHGRFAQHHYPLPLQAQPCGVCIEELHLQDMAHLLSAVATCVVPICLSILPSSASLFPRRCKHARPASGSSTCRASCWEYFRLLFLLPQHNPSSQTGQLHWLHLIKRSGYDTRRPAVCLGLDAPGKPVSLGDNLRHLVYLLGQPHHKGLGSRLVPEGPTCAVCTELSGLFTLWGIHLACNLGLHGNTGRRSMRTEHCCLAITTLLDGNLNCLGLA